VTDETPRSAEICPDCGAQQVSLLQFPRVDVKGVAPLDELIGMGDREPGFQPGIGCLACGAEWPSLEAFRAAQRGGPEADAG
jgi:hypothetical protein